MRHLSLGTLVLAAACSGEIVDGEVPPDPSAPGVPDRKPMPGPGPVTPGGLPTPAGPCAPGPARIWRLTPAQVAASARALAGESKPLLASRLEAFSPRPERFTNEAFHLVGSEPYYGELFSVARELGEQISAKPERVHPCAATSLASDGCVGDLITGFGARAFRRPLTTEETSAYRTFFQAQAEAAGGDRKVALRQTVRRFLLSPHFTFRAELGTPVGSKNLVRLTPHETASALSFLLLDGPPDDELRRAADDGSLARPDELAKHARRLLERPELSAGLLKFLLELSHAPGAAATQRPALKNAQTVLDALPEETTRFLTEVIWKEGGRFSTLLTAPFTFVNATLASHYGLPATTAWTRVPVSGERLGFLTQGAFLTAVPNISARGAFVRELLLCQAALPVPDDVDTDLSAQLAEQQKQGAKITRSQMRELHLKNPSCAACHAQLDPLGKPLDMFGDTGLERAQAEGEAVYRDGAVIGTSDVNSAVRGPRQLIETLARSKDVARCFVQQAFQYTHGRAATDSDRCALDALAGRFAANGDIRQLVVDLVTDEGFVTRTPQGVN